MTNCLHPNTTICCQNSHGPAPLDFTTQTGNADGAEWQEEVYQKIKSMKESYLLDISDVYRIFASKVQQVCYQHLIPLL